MQEWQEVLLHIILFSSPHALNHLPMYSTSGLRISAVSTTCLNWIMCSNDSDKQIYRWPEERGQERILLRSKGQGNARQLDMSAHYQLMRYSCIQIQLCTRQHQNMLCISSSSDLPNGLIWQVIIDNAQPADFYWFSEIFWSWLVPCNCIAELWLLPWLTQESGVHAWICVKVV